MLSIGEAFVFLRFSTFSSLARFPLLTHSGINYPPSASADGPPFLSRKELRFANFPFAILRFHTAEEVQHITVVPIDSHTAFYFPPTSSTDRAVNIIEIKDFIILWTYSQ